MLNLAVSPSVVDGNLEAPRLVALALGTASVHRVQAEIANNEDQKTEFKSTFSCCLRTLRARDDLEPRHYCKPEVEDACLSAIAGLMNTGGGVVLVGVEDSGEVVGLQPDFHALQVPGTDRWLLYVRSKIQAGFADGRAVSSHVDVSFAQLDGLWVARLAVQARPKLTFLNNIENPKCPPKLLRRLGNQTVEVKAGDLEDFFEQRASTRAAN